MDISTFHNSFTDAHLSPSGKHSVHENMKLERSENRKIPKISPPAGLSQSFASHFRFRQLALWFASAAENIKNLPLRFALVKKIWARLVGKSSPPPPSPHASPHYVHRDLLALLSFKWAAPNKKKSLIFAFSFNGYSPLLKRSISLRASKSSHPHTFGRACSKATEVSLCHNEAGYNIGWKRKRAGLTIFNFFFRILCEYPARASAYQRSEKTKCIVPGAHNAERITSTLVSRRFHGPVYFLNGFGANFGSLLNSTNQSAKPSDLKTIFFAFW